MHRDCVRHQRALLFVIFSLSAGALGAAGCFGFVYPPPAIPDVVQKEVFHVGDPVALLSFEPGRVGGSIIGEVHGWPFPHLEQSEGISTGTFTYVGQFKVTARSYENGMPSEAQGSRKIYFYESPPTLNFADPHSYEIGQEVAADAISMSFSFQENHRVVVTRMISQQKSARPFAFRGKKIEPPRERDTADTLQGEYTADLGGYILRSLNE
jgi:hypothetical protein